MVLNILNTENGHTEEGVSPEGWNYRDGFGPRKPQTPQELMAIFYAACSTGHADPDSLKRYTSRVECNNGRYAIGPYVGTPA